MQKKLLILIAIIMLLSVSLFSATTGKLAGRVTDDKGAVAYANVILKGTTIGGMTDDRGRFMIINIPPGTYTVVCQLMGYAAYEISGVRINVDETRTVNIKLVKQTIQMEAVKVKAQEEMITKDRAGSSKSLSADQISDIAVTDIEGVIAMQAGVTQKGGELFVRGGRANEVNFTVDGMSVSDPVDGGSALTVDMDAVADMKVITGGLTAEYGNAQSGMVNIVSKDGSAIYEGKIEGISDHVIPGAFQANYDELKFALGGPIIPFAGEELKRNLTFFINGAGSWTDSRYRKYYNNNPNDDLHYISSAIYESYNPYSDRDKVLGFEIGNRNYNDYNVNLKTKYVISPMQNITLAVRGDRSYNTPFSHGWKYALQHYAESETEQQQVMLTYDLTIGTKSNLKMKLSKFEKTTTQNPRGINKDSYIWRDDNNFDPSSGSLGYSTIDMNGDGIYDYGFHESNSWVYSIEGLDDDVFISGFTAPGRVWDNFIDDKTGTTSFRADYEYQMNEIIGFKSGFEAIKYNIEKNQLGGFLSIDMNRFNNYLLSYGQVYDVVEDEDGNPVTYYTAESYTAAAKASSGSRDGYKAEPWQFAYYLQDKMEWEGMIVNAGVRLDFWYLGKEYSILQDDNTFRKRDFKSEDRLQMMVSPRLGISHPISDRDVVHFAYNYQNQLPPMRYIFTSKDTLDAYSSGGAVTVGNPALEPQITITYEVGLQHQISEDYVGTITAYYKNFYNYVSTAKELSQTEATVYWYNYISQDYGSARGIDLNLSRRMFNFIGADASYSLAWAQGNNSSTVIQDEATNLREFPLDWDIRHNFNFSITFKIDKDEEFFVPFTDWILPLDDFTASLNYNIASGQPYTGVDPVSDVSLDTNGKRQDYSTNADLKLSKRVFVSENSFFRFNFTIENLFKKKTINYVYPKTGSPYYDGADLADATQGYTFEETQFIHDCITKDPSNTNNNRKFVLGVSYNF